MYRMLFFPLKKVQMFKITRHQIPASQQYSWTPLNPSPLLKAGFQKLSHLCGGEYQMFLLEGGIKMKREVV